MGVSRANVIAFSGLYGTFCCTASQYSRVKFASALSSGWLKSARRSDHFDRNGGSAAAAAIADRTNAELSSRVLFLLNRAAQTLTASPGSISIRLCKSFVRLPVASSAQYDRNFAGSSAVSSCPTSFATSSFLPAATRSCSTRRARRTIHSFFDFCASINSPSVIALTSPWNGFGVP